MNVEIGSTIKFKYVNWKGETSVRSCIVLGIVWGSNEWHKEEQWLLHGFDTDKREERHYAMKDMDIDAVEDKPSSNWVLSEEDCIRILESEPVAIKDSEHIKDMFKSKDEQIELCRRILDKRRNM